MLKLAPLDVRRRTVDGRGLADIRLVQVEDGPGRGQRMLLIRNASGIGFEIAVDRGFDISALTWRGANIGWNSSNRMPWPPHSVDAEGGVGLYRNLDGFLVTCGLDHHGGARQEDGGRYIHKHRKEIHHPLHGRISGQRAQISGYGIDWNADEPVIWAEAVVRQTAVFGENLSLTRRIALSVHGHGIRINDVVANEGFRPCPHAILYHINFGYPFLDQTTRLGGDIAPESAEQFNSESKLPEDDFRDFYQDFSISATGKKAQIEVCNPQLSGGTRVRITYPHQALPAFGIWRAYQSGVYVLGVEPALRFAAEGSGASGSVTLNAGDMAKYEVLIGVGPSADVSAEEA